MSLSIIYYQYFEIVCRMVQYFTKYRANYCINKSYRLVQRNKNNDLKALKLKHKRYAQLRISSNGVSILKHWLCIVKY